MKNLLSKEPSLYLKQHSHQPVNWMPWNSDAFTLAEKLNKPIIVSIGYSACHWCHVMSKESFEDKYIASIMNRHFICIKVDREERPDIDQTYLEAVRMFNQSAGWPLNIFCLPNGQPFWGGTYFPNKDKGEGIVPWPQVLMRIADHYNREFNELEENAGNVVSNLIHTNNALLSKDEEWSNEYLIIAAENICKTHDKEYGGFTPAPKFPSPMKLDFLNSIKESQAVKMNTNLNTKISFCINTTLENMCKNGLFDHIGGGFFRYSVDKEWKTPHFEKMLNDNALLISTYSRAYQSFKNEDYKEVVFKTIEWLKHEMFDSNGGFFASVSADSEDSEGDYYLLNLSEIRATLKAEEFELLNQEFSLTNNENFENGRVLPYLDKKQQRKKQNSETARNILLSFRNKKTKPEVDRKKITSWNAMLINAFTDAARAFNKKEWLETAIELNDWMIKKMTSSNLEISSIIFEEDKKSNHGFLDDYAIWAESLLNLSSISEWIIAGSAKTYIDLANKFTLEIIKYFKDKNECGYYFTKLGVEQAAQVRKKFWYDNSTPSGNSSLLRVFATLHHLTGNKIWLKEFNSAKSAYPNLCKKAPQGIGHALTAITEKAVGLCTIKCSPEEIDNLMRDVSKKPYRPIFLKTIPKGTNKDADLIVEDRLIGKSTDPKALIDLLYK